MCSFEVYSLFYFIFCHLMWDWQSGITAGLSLKGETGNVGESLKRGISGNL